MKKILIVTFIVMTIFTSFALAKEFPDVDASHWAYQYISQLSDRGVINGYTDGTFKPSGNVTRAEFLKLIVVAAYGEDYIKAESYFSVYPNWYDVYLSIAYKDNRFSDEYGPGNPEAYLTRKEMMILLGKFKNKILNLDDTDTRFTQNFEFTDFFTKDLRENDKKYANLAYNLGLVNGYDDGSFKPGNNITRAETATVIYRFINGGI